MVSADEENYKEALLAAFKVFAPTGISQEIQDINHDSCAEVGSNSSDFWVMVAALKVCNLKDLTSKHILHIDISNMEGVENVCWGFSIFLIQVSFFF
jgi:hypothetical protein